MLNNNHNNKTTAHPARRRALAPKRARNHDNTPRRWSCTSYNTYNNMDLRAACKK